MQMNSQASRMWHRRPKCGSFCQTSATTRLRGCRSYLLNPFIRPCCSACRRPEQVFPLATYPDVGLADPLRAPVRSAGPSGRASHRGEDAPKARLLGARPGQRNVAPDPRSVISFQSFELPVDPLSSGPSFLQSLLSPPTTPSSCRQSWRVSCRSPRSSRRSPRSSRRSSRRSMRRVSARTMFPSWNRPLPANAAAGVALIPADEIKLSVRTDKRALEFRRRLQVIRFLH